MKYGEWIAQLKLNLDGVSGDGQRLTLEFFDGAYAEKRLAGLSEEAAVESFGEPEAAVRKLIDEGKIERRAEDKEKHFKRNLLFAVLCAFLALPTLALLIVMGLLTMFIAALPFLLIIAGGGFVTSGIVNFKGGTPGTPIALCGTGIAIAGLGIALIKLNFRIIRLLWTGFLKLMGNIASLFKEDGR